MRFAPDEVLRQHAVAVLRDADASAEDRERARAVLLEPPPDFNRLAADELSEWLRLSEIAAGEPAATGPASPTERRAAATFRLIDAARAVADLGVDARSVLPPSATDHARCARCAAFSDGDLEELREVVAEDGHRADGERAGDNPDVIDADVIDADVIDGAGSGAPSTRGGARRAFGPFAMGVVK